MFSALAIVLHPSPSDRQFILHGKRFWASRKNFHRLSYQRDDIRRCIKHLELNYPGIGNYLPMSNPSERCQGVNAEHTEYKRQLEHIKLELDHCRLTMRHELRAMKSVRESETPSTPTNTFHPVAS